jgi:hypothetical protein
MKRIPRVLVVTKILLNEHGGASLSIRNWLHHAFPAHCAQIYSFSQAAAAQSFPEYRLGVAERRFGRVFELLKGRMHRAVAEHQRASTHTSHKQRQRFFTEVFRRLGSFVSSLGLWELIFKPQLSPKLRKFIQDFAPDVIFADGYDLSFTQLPILIHNQFSVPITTIIVDNWEPCLYQNALAQLLGMRAIMRRSFLQLLSKSAQRYCISALMAHEYEQRYGFPFGVLMQVDHRPLHNTGTSQPLDPRHFIVAYSGSLIPQRWTGLSDLAPDPARSAQ